MRQPTCAADNKRRPRHRLPLEPHGFEGLEAAQAADRATQLAILHPGHIHPAEHERRARTSTVSDETDHRHDVVVTVGEDLSQSPTKRRTAVAPLNTPSPSKNGPAQAAMIRTAMTRVRRRHLLVALPILALAVFLVITLLPSSGATAIDIHAEGRDRRLARSVLASGLERLFPKGNGHWRAIYPADSATGSRCIAHRARYTSSTGRAVTATYLFAGWLEVRLTDYVYSDAAAAQRVSSAQAARQVEVCYGQLVAEELRHAGYVAVGFPRVFPGTRLSAGDDAQSSRIEIPSRYKGRRLDWDIDTSAVRRGRIILDLTTVVPEPFQKANEALARELASSIPGSGSAR